MANALDKLIDKLQETYKDGVIMDLRRGGSIPDVERVPLESPKIESLFGIGGVPRGRIIEIFGPESSGKTSLCEYIAGQFQKDDLEYTDEKTGELKTRKGVVVYIDAEHAMSLEYAQIHGFDVSQCILVQPDSGEQALDIAIQFAESGQVDLIVVDSIAALTPQQELDADMDQNSIGLQARMLSKFFRKAAGVLAKTKTTMLCINQIRMNIGGYGNPETTCVTPDTAVDYTTQDPVIFGYHVVHGWKTISDMFKDQGVDWRALPENSRISTDGQLWISSCKIEGTVAKGKLQKVTQLVRKQDSPVYKVFVQYKDYDQPEFLAFKGTPQHRIFAETSGKKYNWYSLEEVARWLELGNCVKVIYSEFAGGIPGEIEISRMEYVPEPQPILDMEVEGTHTYFANGVLSHNTGGKALKFYSSTRIEVRRREYITEKDETRGIIINAKTVKNKTAPPMVRQQLEMYFDKSFDASMEWVDFAVEYQVIASAGAGFFTLPDGTKIRGRANVIEFLKDSAHSEIYESIKKATKERMYKKSEGKRVRVSVDDPEEEAEILREEEKGNVESFQSL